MFKIITMKNVATYNANTHCNLLYALKVWSFLNFILKRRLIFFCLIKLLFVKEICLINVNVSLEANLEGQS